MRLRKLLYMSEGRKERRTCDTSNLSFGYGFVLSNFMSKILFPNSITSISVLLIVMELEKKYVN